MNDLPDYVRRNREVWDRRAREYVAAGEDRWAQDTLSWGIWGVPESQVGMLPEDLAGKDTIELGCGTAYVSAWLARRGARAVGIDNSEAQLATARRLQRRHGLEFPLLHGNAEEVPYADASFDFAISEYGACLWADPRRWVPEAGLRHAPGRLAGRRGRRVPPLARRLDPPAAKLGIRDRESRRGAPSSGRDDAVPVRHARVGAAVAVRGGVESAQAVVNRPGAVLQSRRGSGPRRPRAGAAVFGPTEPPSAVRV